MRHKIKRYNSPPSWDTDDLKIGEHGRGYVAKDGSGSGLTRCPDCKKENYVMSVTDGQCVWCGWSIDESLIPQNET